MSKYFTALLLAGGLFSLADEVQAQVRFSIGPKVGLNVTTADYKTDDRFDTHAALTSELSFRPGAEVGVLATIGWEHWQLQPAVVYSQKGFHLQGTISDVISTDGTFPAPYDYVNRLNYLAFPLNVAYTQFRNGQGLQMYGGLYLGVLLNGHYRLSWPSTAFVVATTGDITAKERPTGFDAFTDYTQFAKHFDAGFQAGMGYRRKATLLQIGYSIGLRNLAAPDYAQWSFIGAGPDYRNWVLQASVAYLFEPKR